jgi:two-component system chemotaxis sensor kinase CheA
VDVSKYAALFLAESRDHLQQCNRLLLAWERHPAAEEPVAGLFRSVHTLKGMAGAMGYDRLAELAHGFENVLQGLRDGRIPASVELVDLGFTVVDRLDRGVALAASGKDEALEVADLLGQLGAATTGNGAPPATTDPAPPGVEELPTASAVAPAPGLARQVRVDLARLDTLVGLAGEVVVGRHRLAAALEEQGSPALVEEVHRLGRLVTDLHGQALYVRMAPVAEVFERFPRAVRDLARQLGKRVRVDMEGDEIELDRAILDELPDLLLHLVRNAVDHGIEAPEERVARGKPVEGVLRLEARRERNAVLVSVSDDGRGIDRDAVFARAERADGAAGLTDEEALLGVLARPGFSTAEAVTDISGRGVGVDAVVHRARQIGGTVQLVTEPGRGTTVTLRLPLTVAIVPALLVNLGGERHAVPLAFVIEAARLPAHTAAGDVVPWREGEVTVVDLGAGPPAGAWRPAVILSVGSRRQALLVDGVLGQLDVVVSRIDAPRGTPDWVQGATILDDGRPALILDPAALF